MIRVEIPSMTQSDGDPISIAGIRVPFGGKVNRHATRPRDIEVPESLALHTSFPFAVAEVQKKPGLLRGHMRKAWGMTFPGDLDVTIAHDSVMVGSPDHFIWPWIEGFFREHQGKAMKFIAPKPCETWGNILWVDAKPQDEFVLLPRRDRSIDFGFTPYRRNERISMEDGRGDNQNSRAFLRSQQITATR